MQTSGDHRSRRRHVNRMTDEKGETWSPSGMSKVRSRPESLVADCSMHDARAAATGKAWSPRVARRVDGTCSVVVSAEQRHRRATISDVGRRLSDKYAGAVPCTRWYGTPDHTTGTGFVPGRVTSEAPVAVGFVF